MPLIHIYCPKSTFETPAKNAMLEELTTIALKIEGLPDNDFVRSTAWTYIHEIEVANCFKAGKPYNANGVLVEVNVFKGGLDFDRKGLLIDKFTQIIKGKISTKVPIYVLIRENETQDWGILGKRITMDNLFNPQPDALPL